MAGSDGFPNDRTGRGGEVGYFNRRSAGYALAEQRFPDARSAELIPFLAQHVGERSCVDVFCGTGFLTRALEARGAKVLPLDLQTEMLGHWSSGASQPEASQSLKELTARVRGLRDTDVYSLAGFHHCFDHADLAEKSLSLAQESMVEAWQEAAGVHGRIMCADVTDTEPGTVVASSELLSCPLHRLPSGARLSSVNTGGVNSTWLEGVLSSVSLGDAIDRLGDVRELCMRSSPRDWFREVVSKRGFHGHEDRFVKPYQSIEAIAKKQITLQYAELPTPWVFPTYASAVWYLATFFGLREVDAADGLDRFLGHSVLPDGCVAVGWRLGVLWRSPKGGSRCERG